MNESETRAEYIDPKLRAAGWGEVEGSKILREFRITDGKILVGSTRSKPDIADYVLVYKNKKLAVVEAKHADLPATEGVAQAKDYATKLQLDYTYATNGKEIYGICMENGKEEYVDSFPTPEDLWHSTFSDENEWKDKFAAVLPKGQYANRYYQEIAINRALDAIAEEKDRILLTLATGTGKTVIAFQIAWKLFQARWNLQRDGSRQPRILFLADRNILADQAFNSFSAFPEDALERIKPSEIRKKGEVPKNRSIFFTIFQIFESGENHEPYFGQYERDFFDFIIIDECHRGGANDESNWRAILEYFSPAVQLGLTATPKRQDNVDTYRYFGEPVYIYSLKQGINDGFLTPFKVKRIKTSLDDYMYTSDDELIEGEVEEGRLYTEPDFNRIIEIKEREETRVRILLSEIDQKEKTIIFCANQTHALAVRDLVNQLKKGTEPQYCVRVTADDGFRGEQYLREFQDNEKTIPTILTTSQKLSTGVDARNVRNIVLMRPVNSMIEFKQIIGRGTRLFDGKEYFTIIDFVDAYKHFSDPQWDGEPIDVSNKPVDSPKLYPEPKDTTSGVRVPRAEYYPEKKVRIKLRDGKEREIQHMVSTSYWGSDGKPVSSEEFLQGLYGALPQFFTDEAQFRALWADPVTRKAFLHTLSEEGYGGEQLHELQKLVNAEDSDLFDVLSYVSFAVKPITRKVRVAESWDSILTYLNPSQTDFI